MTTQKDIVQKRNIANYLIYPELQFRLIAVMFGVALLLYVITTGIFYVFVKHNYGILLNLTTLSEDGKLNYYQDLLSIVLLLLLLNIFMLSFMALLGIKYTHRITGPLYRLKKAFREVAAGDLKIRMKLREHDHFHDVAKAFNEMMEKLASTKNHGN